MTKFYPDRVAKEAWLNDRIDDVETRRWRRKLAAIAEAKALGVALRGPHSGRLPSHPGNSHPCDNRSRAELKARITLPKVGPG